MLPGPAAEICSGSVDRVDARPVTRRKLLVAASVGLIAAAGCTGDGSPTPAPTPGLTSGVSPEIDPGTELDPDAALLSAARRDEARVLHLIEAVLLRHRDLRPQLSPLAEHHRIHLDVLDTEVGVRRPPAVPRTAVAAVRGLQRAERRTSQLRGGEADTAQSGELARYLASMSASSAQHVVVLDALARALPGRDARR